MSAPLRLVIAEDNYLVREGTRRLLEESGEAIVIAAVGTAPELLDAVGRLAPDAVLTDIRMRPGHHMDGIHAAHDIRAEHPHIGVVVLSQHVDEAYAFELLKNGWRPDPPTPQSPRASPCPSPRSRSTSAPSSPSSA